MCIYLGDTLQCAICMEEFKENESAKRLPCSHHFHEECISRWLRMVSISHRKNRLFHKNKTNYLAWNMSHMSCDIRWK